MENDYNERVIKMTKRGYLDNIRNRLYRVLCEREEGKNYNAFLSSIIVEVCGLQDELASINYWALVAKLKALTLPLAYETFRSTIFECISIIGGLEYE